MRSCSFCESVSILPHRTERAKREEAPSERPGGGFLFHGWFGRVLLSHKVSLAVPSALAGLASGFGMGPGVSPPPWRP